MNQSTELLIERVNHLSGESAATSLARRCKVAYLMSRFPKLTETFVLFEMLAVEEQDTDIEVFPLLGGFASGKEVAGASLGRKLKDYFVSRGKPTVMHPEAENYVQRAHYLPFLSGRILLSNLIAFARHPVTFLTTIATVIRENSGNSNFLWGGLAIFPKCVHIASQCRRAGVNHVHSHFANHPATAAYIIHRFTRIPYSFTAHGSDLHRYKNMLRKKVQHAAFVVAISRYNRDVILEHCGQHYASKVVNIHCGVDLKVFRSKLPKENGNRDSQFVCVGTLHEVKGQAYLIAALNQLKVRDVGFHCHFVGDGPDRGRLDALVHENGLEAHVTFHGTKNRTELVDLLQGMDVLVAPSVPTSDGRREGIPVVLMEAMACELPVIASRISGIPELVNSNDIGRLVEPRDISGLTDAMQELALAPEQRQRLGKRARQRVRDAFNLEQNAARLSKLFRTSGLQAAPQLVTESNP